MAKIKILPHEELCPEGAEIESNQDETICEAALRNGIKIEHACETSRLSCQAIPQDEDLEIEIPKYNINMVSEHH